MASPLNRDFRDQLTVIDTADSDDFVQAKIVRVIKGNQFTLRSSRGNVGVSWMVTGIRHDNYANAHRIPVEEAKRKEQRGLYLYPTEGGMPKEMGIDYQEMKRFRGAGRP